MSTILRKVFWFLNTFFMTPIFRLGLGGLLGTPFGGYMMVVKVVGRKSGKTRYAPVNYAIRDGSVYCLSGFRKTADWYRNLLAHPEVELLLPGGPIFARGEPVEDPDERGRMARQVLKNAGFAGFFEGYNPRTISEADLRTKIADIPVIRFRPLGVGSGAFDAGGWAWVWPVLATVGLVWWWLG